MSETISSAFKHITAGTVGGMATVVVGHPMDTIKVRMQAQSGAAKMYSGAIDCLVKTYKTEGFRGYYKGMQSPLLGEGFLNAWQFLAWSQTKALLLGGAERELTIPEYFAAGALTGFVASLVECPIDLFKTQLQTQVLRPKPDFTTFPACVRAIWKESGVRGCYQGLPSNFLRTVPASASYFGTYEYARHCLARPGQARDDLATPYVLLAGGLGGFAYWAAVYPIDSVKSAMQADSYRRSERQYSTVIDCARKMYRDGGARRFFAGLAPCLVRSMPANAACFFAYEKALALMT